MRQEAPLQSYQRESWTGMTWQVPPDFDSVCLGVQEGAAWEIRNSEPCEISLTPKVSAWVPGISDEHPWAPRQPEVQVLVNDLAL